MTTTPTRVEVRLSETSPQKAVTRSRLTSFLQRYALLVIFAGIIVFFSTYSGTASAFATRENFITLIGNQAVASIIALAIVVPLTAGIFDLSVAGTTGVSSIACATTMARFHGPVWLAVIVGLACGIVVGVANGYLITRFDLDPIVETLGMSILLGGIAIWYTNSLPISEGISRTFQDFGSLNWLGAPRLLVVLIPVVIATWYVLEHTPFGRYLSAIGANRNAARLVGIRVDRCIQQSLVISGVLGAGAGVLLTARAGSADTQTGPSYLFPALAAVVLGATTIKPGKPNALGAIVGVFFVAAAVSGLSIAGASAWAPAVFNGGSLIAALVMTAIFARRRARTKKVGD